jgi:hypothetical protein
MPETYPKFYLIPSAPDYAATEDGDIYALFRIRRPRFDQPADAPRKLRTSLGGANRKVYGRVGTWVDGKKVTRLVHRLVCEAFHGRCPHPNWQAVNIDGDGRNNRFDNLEWRAPPVTARCLFCTDCGVTIAGTYSKLCRTCSGKQRTRSIAERFWPMVDKRGHDECWPWLGSLSSAGYGQMSRPGGGSPLLAPRVSWEIHFGPIPFGKCVLHKNFVCHNPACVNAPAHLYLGTRRDNNRDTGIIENHGMLSIPADDVHEIRRLAAAGISYEELARRFGVSAVSCSRLARHLQRKHLP